MTTEQARYVIEHRDMYDTATYMYAVEILEHARAERNSSRFDDYGPCDY